MRKTVTHSCVLSCLVVLTWIAAYQQSTIQVETAIYPESFGAIGDGVADDTAALQAAINAAPTRFRGGEIILSRLYRITAPLEIINDAAHGRRVAIPIRGLNAAPGGFSRQTGIIWAGPSDQAIIKLYTRECVMRNFVIYVDSGHSARAAIEIDQVPGEVANTRNFFEGLWIDAGYRAGRTTGQLENGVIIGPRPGVYNLDYMTFRQCFFSNIKESCVDIQSTTGQSKHNLFEQCFFLDAKYGIKQTSGSFEANSCAFGTLRGAAISLYAPTDNILIVNPDSESCARFIESRAGGSGGFPLLIQGGRFELDKLAEDGRYINWGYSGPLTIQGAQFSQVPMPRFRIHAEAAGPGGQLIIMGCQFPNATPYEAVNTRLKAFGNRGADASGGAILLADQ